MKVLILRDLRAYSTFFLLIFTIMILYSYLNIRFGTVDGIVGFLLILGPSAASIVLFAGDEGLMTLFCSLPTSRKSLVLSKYLSTVIISTALIISVMLILWVLGNSYPHAFSDLVRLLSPKGLLFAYLPAILIVCISYPFIFRYGLKIGVRILIIFMSISYGGGIVLLEEIIENNFLLERRGIFFEVMTVLDKFVQQVSPLLFYSGILLFLIIMIAGSITLSLKWFKKRDIIE